MGPARGPARRVGKGLASLSGRRGRVEVGGLKQSRLVESVGARALGSDARAKVNRAIDSAAAAATSGGTLSCCSLAHGRTRSDTKARRVRLEAEGFMAEEACTRTSQQPTARTGQGRRVRPTQRPGRRRSPGGRPTAAVAAAAAATAGASEEEERGRTGRWVRS